MEQKTLNVLEYPKILDAVASHCQFSTSKELVLAISPSTNIDQITRWQKETSEAKKLLSIHDLSVGGARDIRKQILLAQRGGVLNEQELLDIKYTLISSRELRAFFINKTKVEHEGTLNPSYPNLSEHALGIVIPTGVIDSISKTISDKGEVLDHASDKLRSIRSELHIARNRLLSRLQQYLGDQKTAPMLQESIITQRDGRYVIPLRSEFKGQIKSIVHDQSSSGATLFVEPLAVVEMNNALRELELDERNEVRRILYELSSLVGDSSQDMLETLNAIATIDMVLARAKYSEQIDASEPIMRKRDSKDPEDSIQIDQARHPLLNTKTAVANNIRFGTGINTMIITGPNTGGKTVTLKTIGLLAVMAQSGLHIPANSGSVLPVFKAIFADIGDEQSIEQSLSTFSGHMTNIVSILEKADENSLVIFDELGAGTDPQEGSSLAMSIVKYLLEKNITTLVATHYPELKAFAHNTPAVVNASLEFNVGTLKPTYRLTIGLPGRSNAFAIASKLGLPQHIIEDAKQGVDPANLRADKLLDDIRKERNRASKERDKLLKNRQKYDEMLKELSSRLEQIEDERLRTLQSAKAEHELELEILKKNISRLRGEYRKLLKPVQQIEELSAMVEKVEQQVNTPVVRKIHEETKPKIDLREIKLGDKVYMANLNSSGIVTGLTVDDAEIQIGNMRIRAKLKELSREPSNPAEPTTNEDRRQKRIKKMADNLSGGDNNNNAKRSFAVGLSVELDLRGQSSEDALSILSDYIDKAYLAGAPFSRIIHGKGTGKLRQEVRKFLEDHEYVASYEEGHPNEGGDGVTVVKFVD